MEVYKLVRKISQFKDGFRNMFRRGTINVFGFICNDYCSGSSLTSIADLLSVRNRAISDSLRKQPDHCESIRGGVSQPNTQIQQQRKKAK